MASRPTPNLDGLSAPFEVEVDGRTVRCTWILREYFLPKYPTNKDVIDETNRRYLLCPSRKVAVAAMQLKQGEMDENPGVAIIQGVPTFRWRGGRSHATDPVVDVIDRWGQTESKGLRYTYRWYVVRFLVEVPDQ